MSQTILLFENFLQNRFIQLKTNFSRVIYIPAGSVFEIFQNFKVIYLVEKRGGHQMHVYVLEHIISLCPGTAR